MNIDTTKLTWHQLWIYTSCGEKWELLLFLLLMSLACGAVLFLIKQIPMKYKWKSFLSSFFSMFILIFSSLFPTILINFLVNLTGIVISIFVSGIALCIGLCLGNHKPKS